MFNVYGIYLESEMAYAQVDSLFGDGSIAIEGVFKTIGNALKAFWEWIKKENQRMASEVS